MIKETEYFYHVTLSNPRSADRISFEFNNPVDANTFARQALDSFDAIHELDVSIDISRRFRLTAEEGENMIDGVKPDAV